MRMPSQWTSLSSFWHVRYEFCKLCTSVFIECVQRMHLLSLPNILSVCYDDDVIMQNASTNAKKACKQAINYCSVLVLFERASKLLILRVGNSYKKFNVDGVDSKTEEEQFYTFNLVYCISACTRFSFLFSLNDWLLTASKRFIRFSFV